MNTLVSLVITDIVDSTRRWNAAEGAMAADLELHDRLVRTVVERAGGSVFKHTGDGMIAVFDGPAAATTAAAGIQLAIGAAHWQQPDGMRIRAAVHTGMVYPRDGDLFGTAVNRVARLLAVCPPGAVLVSGATAALLTDRAPEGFSLRRVGPVALAGFGSTDDVHALTGSGLTWVASIATAPIDVGGPATLRFELPPIHDDLVGRTDELATLWDLLGRTHLLTLVGPGGMGKTRLALELASGAVAAFDRAVWWIDLTNATSSEAVVPVAIAAVGAREAQGRTPLQALCDRFAGVNGLVVVDNCEHVLAAASEMVDALRTATSGLRIVCTSREALGLRGEQIVPIGSLPPDDGVRLFRARALAIRPDLDLDEHRDLIERICRRLDGIPLAIELAAARCRSLTPAEINELLSDRFRLLRGGRNGVERHRTLLAAVAWSYSLLDADERAVFDQMAVFAGGALVDALVAVTGSNSLDVLDVLDRLVARSMVVATTTSLGTRYHQLETLRQYAEDRLMERDTIGEVRDRHLDWAASLAQALFRSRGVEAEAAGFARFGAEVDNLRVAVAHALDADRYDTACLVVALLARWALDAPVFEVLDWVRPFPEGQAWTPVSAACAAAGAWADAARGIRFCRAESTSDLPDWCSEAPTTTVRAFVATHTISGGDWRIALEMLDGLAPNSDFERLSIDNQRLLVLFYRQFSDPLDDAELDWLIEFCAHTVELARRIDATASLGLALQSAAYVLAWRRPDLAITYAREALDVGERLGAGTVIDGAHTAFAFASSRSLPHNDLITELRHRTAAVLDSNYVYQAASLAATLSSWLAPHDPLAMIDYLVVWSRVTGVDSHRILADSGVDVPDDLEVRQHQLADRSLPEAIGHLLAAIDRMVAAHVGGDG